ncbi:glycine betaine ABC transporter substrate-binding protein [Streptomyces albicerus]|uniref:glycine betaine ABC transporter substrate-binding protein n=1 Tax=Streptomyces albicerus TaxID=2569859 RepID=UPI00124B4AFB|nr:glycine betaine ABC transporter substrate-binding protein [Streptomyces albicerus]
MRNKCLTITLLTVIAASLTACSGNAQTTSSASGKKTVTIGAVAYDETIASSYLWKELLEEQGYTVKVSQLELGSVYAGVANGQLDMFTTGVPKIHADYYSRFGSKFTALNKWYSPVTQAVAVPTSTGLTSMDQLASHAAEFGSQIVGIESGSGLMRDLHNKAVKDYGLQKYTVIDGSTPAMLAALDKAMKEKKSVAVTLWQPHWAFSKYPLTLLKDPKNAFGGSDSFEVVANKKFVGSNAKLAAEFKKFSMTADQLQSLELMINQAGAGHEQEAAKKWIQKNQSAVKEWTSAGTS